MCPRIYTGAAVDAAVSRTGRTALWLAAEQQHASVVQVRKVPSILRPLVPPHNLHTTTVEPTWILLKISHFVPSKWQVGKRYAPGRKGWGVQGAHLNPLGLFLRTSTPCIWVMAYSECRPTRLNPLAERTCFSQVRAIPCSVWHAPWYQANTVASMPSEVRSSPKRCSHSGVPLYISLVIIRTKYTGVRQNGSNV